jgi:hypothetical protein
MSTILAHRAYIVFLSEALGGVNGCTKISEMVTAVLQYRGRTDAIDCFAPHNMSTNQADN